MNWVIEAYRTQALQGTAPQRQLRLSEKEMMIISGVTQGMKNKDIAREVKHDGAGGEELSAEKSTTSSTSLTALSLRFTACTPRLLDGYVFRSSEKPDGVAENKPPATDPPPGPQEVSQNTGGTASAAAVGQHAKQKHA